jgi:hypothetical protein
MARQEDTCWRCRTGWATEDEPRGPVRVIVGRARTPVAAAQEPRIPVAVADDEGAATAALLGADRWMNDGGSFDSEATPPPRATTPRR